MYIKISNTAREVVGLDLKDEIAVVIDVLRATTTMVNGLKHGIKRIKTFADIDEARKYKMENPGIILGGERNAIKPHDFDCGNSPLEYTGFEGRELAMTTTNGTLALNNSKAAKEVLIMSFHNIPATVEYLRRKKSNIRFVCAGTDGEFSLDDAFCAAEAIKELLKSGEYNIDDMAKLLLHNINDREEVVQKAKHYETLAKKGFEEDLSFAFEYIEKGFVAKVEGEYIIKVVE